MVLAAVRFAQYQVFAPAPLYSPELLLEVWMVLAELCLGCYILEL